MLYSEGVEDRLRTPMVVPLLYTRIQRKPSAVLWYVPCSEVNSGDHLLDPPEGYGLPDPSLLTAFKGVTCLHFVQRTILASPFPRERLPPSSHDPSA